MRIFLKKVWVKVRLTVIIILSIVIGAVWMYNYQSFAIMKCEAEETWTQIQQIQEQRKEIKIDVDDAQEVESRDEASREVSLEGEADNKPFVSPPSIEDLIKKYFKDDYQTALAIATAESRMRTVVYHKNSNGTMDCSIFQINSIHNPTREQCENAEENIKLAYRIYQKSGWKAWATYNSSKYLEFL